jgi:hypothetical protein
MVSATIEEMERAGRDVGFMAGDLPGVRSSGTGGCTPKGGIRGKNRKSDFGAAD